MNCFGWQNISSDFIDGTLIGVRKKEADAHLDGCERCAERYRRYRLIIDSIADQPRSTLPIPIRKAPLSVALPKADASRFSRRRWERVPWYLRTTVEASAIVFVTLLGISSAPKIRALYEQKVERSLSELGNGFSDGGESSTAVARSVSNGPATGEASAHVDEFSGEGENEDEENEDTPEIDDEIRVGNADIWRFILKTDSPQELQPKVTAFLKSLRAAGEPDTGEASGVRAPGGIQFDLLLPQDAIPQLKKSLSGVAQPVPEGLADSPVGETFTWYKIRSKKKIPAGKTRVVIWISQM